MHRLPFSSGLVMALGFFLFVAPLSAQAQTVDGGSNGFGGGTITVTAGSPGVPSGGGGGGAPSGGGGGGSAQPASSGGGSGGGVVSQGPPLQAGLDGYGATNCGLTGGCVAGTAGAPSSALQNAVGAALCAQGGTCPAPAAAGAPAGAPAAPAPPPVPPAVVAQLAVSQMQLRAPQIGIVPENFPGSVGLVGLPVYMWVADPGPSTVGPITTTAAAGATVVTATGVLDRIVWSMGDGRSVTCAGGNARGTVYQPSFGAAMSPTCGYRYDRSSEGKPGDAYRVSATSFWTINWVGGGQAGVIQRQYNNATSIQVGELQVLGSK